MEHIPDHRNKAADCLSWLPFTTRKRNDNPLKDEDVSIHETKVEVGKSDKLCIRIAKLMEDPRIGFMKDILMV